MEDAKRKEENPKGNKAKKVLEWSKAVESAAKALIAVVGLVVLIIAKFWEKS